MEVLLRKSDFNGAFSIATTGGYWGFQLQGHDPARRTQEVGVSWRLDRWAWVMVQPPPTPYP